MKKFSTLALILLTSCGTVVKHEKEFKDISHDTVDEGIDDLIKKTHENK